MSPIPTRHIDGDAVVGRNVTAGGDANIQGKMRIGHDLRVDGWLEARNLRGAMKGLFGSEAELKAEYPECRPGWYALVGETLPAEIWVAGRDGRWHNTGHTGGEPSLDLAGLKNRMDSCEDKSDEALSIAESLRDEMVGEGYYVASISPAELNEVLRGTMDGLTC